MVDELELQNYRKFTAAIGTAFMATDDIKTKKVLMSIAETIYDLHNHEITIEEWTQIEEKAYFLYTELLLNNSLGEESKVTIAAYMEKILANKKPIEEEIVPNIKK